MIEVSDSVSLFIISRYLIGIPIFNDVRNLEISQIISIFALRNRNRIEAISIVLQAVLLKFYVIKNIKVL